MSAPSLAPVARAPPMSGASRALAKIRDEPVTFGFLGLTVAALGLGLRSLYNNDKRMSQLMMRARVFFQLCTVSALVGSLYYRAYATDGARDGMFRAALRRAATAPQCTASHCAASRPRPHCAPHEPTPLPSRRAQQSAPPRRRPPRSCSSRARSPTRALRTRSRSSSSKTRSARARRFAEQRAARARRCVEACAR
jgi:hypothetical protein